MRFEDTYAIVFSIYRVLGLVPSQFNRLQTQNFTVVIKNRHRFYSIVEYFWIICLLIFEFYILIYSLILCYQYILHVHVTLYVGFDVFILTMMRTLVIIITVESFGKRNVQVNILNNLFEIDTIFMQNLNFNIDYSQSRRSIRNNFLKWCGVYIFTESFLIGMNLYEGANGLQDFLLLFGNPLLKLTLSGSKYITFALLIKCRIDAMHETMTPNSFSMQTNSTQTFNHLQQFTIDQNIELHRMISLWQIFNKMHETIKLINYNFNWSISIHFSVEILSTCAILFHILDYILGPPNRFFLISAITFGIYLTYHVFRVGILIQIAHCTAEAVGLLAHKVHRLSANGRASDGLQHFVSLIFVSLFASQQIIIRLKIAFLFEFEGTTVLIATNASEDLFHHSNLITLS